MLPKNDTAGAGKEILEICRNSLFFMTELAIIDNDWSRKTDTFGESESFV